MSDIIAIDFGTSNSYFALYNNDLREDSARKVQRIEEYKALTEKFGKAGDCIACGQCEGICPQKLPIIELLKRIAMLFGEE